MLAFVGVADAPSVLESLELTTQAVSLLWNQVRQFGLPRWHYDFSSTTFAWISKALLTHREKLMMAAAPTRTQLRLDIVLSPTLLNDGLKVVEHLANHEPGPECLDLVQALVGLLQARYRGGRIPLLPLFLCDTSALYGTVQCFYALVSNPSTRGTIQAAEAIVHPALLDLMDFCEQVNRFDPAPSSDPLAITFRCLVVLAADSVVFSTLSVDTFIRGAKYVTHVRDEDLEVVCVDGLTVQRCIDDFMLQVELARAQKVRWDGFREGWVAARAVGHAADADADADMDAAFAAFKGVVEASVATCAKGSP
jgi:hypothetical protein